MKVLSSNRDLYDFLVALQARLNLAGDKELADAVGVALGNASSMNAEFLGESRIALQRVLGEERGLLNEQERRDVSDVLGQLGAVMERR